MSKISLTFHDLSAAAAAAMLAYAGSNFSSDDQDEEDTGPVNGAAPALDSAGLPWDARIHAKTKAQNADGSWKAGRKVDPSVKAQVEAELRARVASPIPPTMGNAPTPPLSQPPAPPAAPNYGNPVPNAAPAAAAQPAFTPTVPAAPPVAPSPAQPAPIPTQPQPTANDPFTAFLGGIQASMTAGKVSQANLDAYTTEINQAWQTNFTAITDFPTRPDIINWAIQLFQRDGRW